MVHTSSTMRTVFCLVLGNNDVLDLNFPNHALTAEFKYRLGDSVVSSADDGVIGLDPDHPDYAQLELGNDEIEAKYMKDEMLLDSTHSIGPFFRGSRERAIHLLVKPIFRHGMGWTIHPDYTFLSLNVTEPLILSSFRRPSENDANHSKRLLKYLVVGESEVYSTEFYADEIIHQLRVALVKDHGWSCSPGVVQLYVLKENGTQTVPGLQPTTFTHVSLPLVM